MARRPSAFFAVLLMATSFVVAPVRADLAQAPGPASPDYSFRTPVGVLVFHVRLEAAADFEAVVARIQQGLESTTDATRKVQGKQLRVLRAADLVGGAVLFVFLIEPVVPNADYDPVRMLTELAPSESAALFDRLKAAVIKVERVGLTELRSQK